MKKNNWITVFVIVLSSLCFTSCTKVFNKTTSLFGKEAVEKIAKKSAKEISEEVTTKSAKTTTKAIQKGIKEISEESLELATKKSLKELAKSNTIYKELYDDFVSRISKEFADGISVQTTKEGTMLFSKEFPTSAIKIRKNIIHGKAGSLIDEGPVNQFLNTLLPNKTYIVDDVFIYQTDDLGRVISCQADRSKAYKVLAGRRNPQRNSDIQKLVVNKLDGKVGADDAGHLFANTTGGPNELINQVPMAKSLNRNGQWRELERLEEEALQQGKTVISQRKLLYKGNEKRPYAIEFITKIDGQETKTIVQNID